MKKNIRNIRWKCSLLLLFAAHCAWSQADRIVVYEGELLSEVLMRVQDQKNVSFLYEATLFDHLQLAANCGPERNVSTLLKKILPPLGLTFHKAGRRNYIIKSFAPTSGPLSGAPTSGQEKPTIEISGQLKDEQGEALVGGTLFVMGTATGTVTDENGFFKLHLPEEQSVVRVSYIGYRDRYLQIKRSGLRNITLSAMANTLEEIVVTALGQEADKKELGFAVDHVGAQALSQSNAYNLTGALAMQTPGVWATSSAGAPGASSSLTIRGFRSINGSNQPLYVLDGVPVDNTSTGNGTRGVDVSNRLIDINLQDIESVSVLRGASAAALYGIRAANGAVIISSKRGKLGAPKFSYESSFGLDLVSQLPPRQQLWSQGSYSNGQRVYRGPESNVNTSYGPLTADLEYDGSTDYPYDQNGRLVPKGSGNGQPANVYDPYKAFFVPGWTYQNHFSVSGGTSLVRYYMSVGHLKDAGVVPNAFYERSSIKGVFEFDPIKHLRVELRPSFTFSRSVRTKRGSMFSGVTLGLFRAPNTFDIGNGKTGRSASAFAGSYLLDDGRQRSYRANGSYDNPFWTINRNPYQGRVNRALQQFSLHYELGPSWSLSYQAGFDHYKDHRQNAFDIHSGSYPQGYLQFTDIAFTHYNGDLLLQTEQQINTNWNLKGTLGHNYFRSQLSIQETKGDELERAGIYLLSNAINLSFDEVIFQKKMAGVFGDLTFAYRDRLFLNFSGRKDWSSTLPVNHNAFFYPGANIGLVMTPWLARKVDPGLTFAKLRMSYSRTGNDADVYLTDTYFRPAVAGGDDLLPHLRFPAFGVTALERSSVLGNSALRPETSRNLELGMELEWWDSRIGLDASWYWNRSYDQIVNAQLSAATGYLRSPVNGGSIDTRGLDVQLKASILKNKYWQWTTTLNFTQYESIVTEMPAGLSTIVLDSYTNLSSVIIKGQPYGVLLGTSIKRNAFGDQVIDSNGFPLLNEEQTVIGDPNPDWLLGIHQRLQYKGFSCFMLWDIRKGGDIWNGTRGVLSYLGLSETSGLLRNEKEVVFEGVTESGEVNTVAVDLAAPENGMSGIYWRRYGFLGLAEEHIEDASWLRLRNLGFSYSFRTGKEGQQFSPAVTLSISAYNLILITPYTGIDPDTNLRGDSNIRGWDYFNSPGTKGGKFKINVTF